MVSSSSFVVAAFTTLLSNVEIARMRPLNMADVSWGVLDDDADGRFLFLSFVALFASCLPAA